MHLGIGRIAGQHCGGFTEVTLGSAPNIPLPLNMIMPFHVPVGKMAFWLKRSLEKYGEKGEIIPKRKGKNLWLNV